MAKDNFTAKVASMEIELGMSCLLYTSDAADE